MSFSRHIIVFLLIWALLIYIFVSKLSASGGVNKHDENIEKLNRALAYIESSNQLDNELRQLLDEFSNDVVNSDNKVDLIKRIRSKLSDDAGAKHSRSSVNQKLIIPSIEHEQYRRRIGSNIAELWNFISTETQQLQKSLSNNNDAQQALKQLSNFVDLAREHKRSLISDFAQLKKTDGYDHFRQIESEDLSNLVQKRLKTLQNPADCDSAKKLVCKINKGCGYGCQLHHIVYCFIMAYATERTLILKSKGWRYHKGGWEEIFMPVSDTCLSSSGKSTGTWPANEDTQVITVPIIDSLNPRPSFLPLSIPADLAPRLMRSHGDPIAWWIGQFLKYILKPQPHTQELLDNGREKLGFKGPIVGVHVRRTDKVGTEASFHSLEEYMKYVDEYYDQLEMLEKVDKRRIFLASDDPKVIEEAKGKYPHYEVIGDPEIAKVAAVSTRYTDSSLNGIMLDIDLLSRCDFLVCTFSSQVCRVAYEIMQGIYPDAYDRFKSLDDIYYYGGQNAHDVVAVLDHKPKNHEQIHMKAGDLVGIAGNHWNGFSKGKNKRTNEMGLFPSFKINNKVAVADFPKYTHVDEM